MALLLYLLPNLEELEYFWIGQRMHQIGLILERMVAGEKPFDQRPGLPRLCQAHIKLIHTAQGSFPLQRLRPFYQLPSMRVLKVQRAIGGFASDDQLPDNSSTIEHLEIVQSRMPNGCCELIAPCKNLKSFKYSHHDGSGLDIAAFSQSLGAKSNTLEELSVGYCRGESDVADSQSFGSLRDYTALKRLRLRMDNLGDTPGSPLVDILPSSLESLSISDTSGDEGKHKLLVAKLCDLVKASRVALPRFKLLDIEGDFQNPTLSSQERREGLRVYPGPSSLLLPWIYEITKETRTICLETGVSFTIRDIGIERQINNLPDYHPDNLPEYNPVALQQLQGEHLENVTFSLDNFLML
ncbi:hypothetical protein BDV26DRAFT_110256 [Aspergillus bertholletiae]|uniref:Leucine-rich repeat domain-containing protein n=1 Tax=Aspergillus bertholletiae TaxID=1226010 RepID=A0A5N7BGQ8_9EURO|nr:hypothetical protein BDV26DRAFT_110256 [Aspergillus bertholletiae]